MFDAGGWLSWQGESDDCAATRDDADGIECALGFPGRVVSQNRRRRHGLLLRDPAASSSRSDVKISAEPGDRAHRPVGLRQVDVPALAEPDERHHSRAHASRDRSASTARTSTRRRSTSSICGGASGWCSRSRTRSRSRSSRTSPTACASTGMTRSREELRGRVEASLKAAALWDEVQGSAAALRRWRSRAASSSGCASRARWRSSPRSC